VLPVDAALVEIDETWLVQMVKRSPRRIWYSIFAYHKLTYSIALAMAIDTSIHHQQTNIRALSSLTKIFKHPLAEVCVVSLTLWSYRLTTRAVNETLLDPGASSPILTSSKSCSGCQQFGPILRVPVLLVSVLLKLLAGGATVVVTVAAAAVRWPRRVALAGDPEAGNMASMIDLKVCGELAMIREGIIHH
jgi:hypothetical protein